MANTSEKKPLLQTQLIWNYICPIITWFSSLFLQKTNKLSLLAF